MSHFTKKRNSLSSRCLSGFTGTGMYACYNKKEVETFINPSERIVNNKPLVYGDDDTRSRIKDYSSIKKNIEKLFEPTKKWTRTRIAPICEL